MRRFAQFSIYLGAMFALLGMLALSAGPVLHALEDHHEQEHHAEQEPCSVCQLLASTASLESGANPVASFVPSLALASPPIPPGPVLDDLVVDDSPPRAPPRCI